MKISYNWLKEYIDGLPSAEETARILTGIGLEVESVSGWDSVKGGLEGVVVAEVLTCEKHPNADKLSKTTVNTGNGVVLPIVCGAPNVRAGQKVLVATTGTVLYKGKESFTIQKTKIRGEVSEGMICAEDELGLGEDHSGIMVLEPTAIPGTPAREYLRVVSDVVFEIGLTPNRIDSASHYGVARDLAAFLLVEGKPKLKRPSVDAFQPDSDSQKVEVVIEEEAGCKRYSGLTMTGLKIEPSPVWLQNRLKAIGLNPINNVVDITNFVLHETGQPLHAFDLSKVKGKVVKVKTLPGDTPFVTLDGQTRKLSAEDLMICNAQEGMCIAGVFGGEESGVTDSTTAIFLESACFNPVYVRKTSRRHLLFTDSSFRFERGSDPGITVYALQRAALLIKEIAGGEISSEIVDVQTGRIERATVRLEYSYLDTLIGKKLERPLVKKILDSLDIDILKEDTAGLSLLIPTYRVEVTCPADVVEEVLRIYGYNRIEVSSHVSASLSGMPKPDRDKIQELISGMLSSVGFNEIMNNSLTKASYYEKENMQDPGLVRIYNPLSSDLNAMRKTLLFGGLESIQYNANRKNEDLKLYEFGNIYRLRKGEGTGLKGVENYFEQTRLSLFVSGKIHAQSWIVPQRDAGFYYIKSFVEMVLRRLGIPVEKLETMDSGSEYLREGLKLSHKNEILVEYGTVNPSLCRQFDLEQEVCWADFNWDALIELQKGRTTSFRNLPRYPEVKRDLSLLMDREVSFENIRKTAFRAESKLLVSMNLFDVFEGEKIGQGKKSYAISFILRDEEQTLTDKQIDSAMERIRLALEKELQAKVRM